ncbi:hypothetical protein JI721_09445 [Alicyclobacillus cycloheptanicus]|uniref:Zn finger protein HypA/HybF involved in hydrogenase expression n=1 Tax=Alicyclobacillus cycloheptanicus TaxID=1457 RepID=A0ABT9XMJ0_9BACL|nr:cold-inducible protein YdjO-related protein [Alicyclobacillus cycloheptanicus]MDQ0191503.1 Zn finger protein HypA/HybF involved in hydrogenase expression [Alicyclobacillus cycloheptanicus]WDL99994.1 hypothetical protein JI721_09445 [Alicyclobacillus cycloheptanicus]
MGYFGHKRKLDEQVFANSVVWQCSKCDCWSRQEFIYVEHPVCPICKGEMNQVTKNIRIE